MATKSWGAKGVWIWETKKGLLERWYKSWNCPEGQNLDRWLWEEQFLVQVEEAAAWIWGPMSCLVCLENKIQCSVAFLVDEITRDSGWFPASTWTHASPDFQALCCISFQSSWAHPWARHGATHNSSPLYPVISFHTPQHLPPSLCPSSGLHPKLETGVKGQRSLLH